MRADGNRRKLIYQCDAYLITDFIIEFSFEDRNGMLFAIYTICFLFAVCSLSDRSGFKIVERSGERLNVSKMSNGNEKVVRIRRT